MLTSSGPITSILENEVLSIIKLSQLNRYKPRLINKNILKNLFRMINYHQFSTQS
jgi:hypothetical protein